MSQDKTNLHKFIQSQQYQPSIAESNVKSIAIQGISDIVNKFKAYVPRSTMVDVKQLQQSTYLKIKKYKDSAYYGEIVNGKRHGKGVMLYGNKRIFEGNWECDFKNGKGYEEFDNGCVYQGYYVNGKPEGVGKYQWPNGEYYEGQWLSGLRHGSGMWEGAKGDSYVGQWKFGKADGYGVHVWINGDRYEGQFSQCLKHGQGTQRYSSGDIYKGEFFKGKPNGYGEYYWKNGSYFKGLFKMGRREGQGIWKKSSGNSDKYEGQYYQDKKNGYGIFSWYNGNIYKGSYQNDERHGYGQMYWLDGSYYKGEWKAGMQEGQGIIFTPEDGIKKGIFKENVLIQIFMEEDPVLCFPVMLKKKRKGKNILPSSSNKMIIMENAKKINPMNKQKRYNSLQITAKNRNQSLRNKIILTNRNKNYSTSRKVEMSPKKPEQSKSYIFKGKNHNNLQLQSKELSPILQFKKEPMPHSSVYMHKIQKRMSALGNSANPRFERSTREAYTNISKYEDTKPTTVNNSRKLHQSTYL